MLINGCLRVVHYRVMHFIRTQKGGTRRGVPGVVEETAAPQLVLPSGWRVEEARVGAIEAVQAVLRVLGGVAVNYVQQHHYAHRVSRVDHPLQFFWGPVPTKQTHTCA